MKYLLLSLLLVLAIESKPSLAEGIAFGEPSCRATGCPSGTASSVLDASSNQLSLQLDRIKPLVLQFRSRK